MAPPKSTTDTEPKKKSKSPSPSPSTGGKTYKDLIIEGIIATNSRKGATRPALKKYIKEHYTATGESAQFDHYFNQALRKGVETGEFEQPKGPSGPVKLAKGKSPSPSPSAKASKVTKPKSKKASSSNTTTHDAASPEKTSPKGHSKESKSKTKTKTKTKTMENAKAKTKTKAEAATASAKAKIRSKSKVRTSKSSSSSSSSSGLTYREMIIKTILKFNKSKGASRIALKKEIKNQYADKLANIKNFDHYFNAALKKAVENGDLRQPKGPSGVIKVLKKGERSVSA